MHAFTFDCPACRTRQRLETRFHPGKQYLCPGCNQVIDLTEDDIKSTERSHPLAFRCPECHTVQHAEEYEYLGDVDGWYTTNVRCPGCGKDVTIREETITTYLERQKEGGRAGDRTDGAVPARPPAGKRPAENPWTKIAAERRRASACAVLALVLALAGLFLRFVPGIAEPFRGVRPGDGPAAFIEYVLPDSTVMRDDLSYLASSADARTVRATRMDGTAVTVPFGKFVA